MTIWVTIGLSVAAMLILAIFFTAVLGWANRAFHVPVDPRIEACVEALPGANCGGCGFVGCREYAAAVVCDGAPVDRCTVGGQACTEALAAIMGVDPTPSLPYRPVVHCGAHTADRLLRAPYRGEPACAAANLVTGVQGCTYGCLGFGDCQRACLFDAIHVIDGLATVDYTRCVGCGACARACPRNIITMAPFKAERILAVACSNKDSGRDVQRVCKVGCIGCKACQRTCSLFTVEDNLPSIDYEAYCPDDLGDAIRAMAKCPRHRIVVVGKPSAKDLAALGDEALPDVVAPDFKTTVDDTEWRG